MKHKKAIYPFICAPKCSASPKNDLFLQGNAVLMPGQKTVIFEPKKAPKTWKFVSPLSPMSYKNPSNG
jgi:hypothetical protein